MGGTDKTARCNTKEEEGKKQQWKDEALRHQQQWETPVRKRSSSPGWWGSPRWELQSCWTTPANAVMNRPNGEPEKTLISAHIIYWILKYKFWDEVFISVVEWLSSALPGLWISRLSGALVTWIETCPWRSWLAATVWSLQGSPGNLGLILLLLKLSEGRQAACSGKD